MGQRSQIYVKYADCGGIKLVFRYFHWNYGPYMVSRARQLIELLSENRVYLSEDEVVRYAEANFDSRSVSISSDIISGYDDSASYKWMAQGQDNNDGFLLIDATNEEELKYAFSFFPATDHWLPLDALSYMLEDCSEWDDDDDEYCLSKSDRAIVKRNHDFITKHAKLMTEKETNSFFDNIKKKKVVA